MREAWSIGSSALPLVTTAIHAGHDLRPEVAEHMALDHGTRRREEDPFTDRIARAGGLDIVVHRSRFEVDLNRPRHTCVYTSPEQAWGLDLWHSPLTDEQIERSRRLHDAFYAMLGGFLDDLAARDRFVILDIHSYNHRRGGPGAGPAPEAENPEVNIGTGSLDRDLWGHVVDRFMGDLREQVVAGHRLDVRENVKFSGGELSKWCHREFPQSVCALAIEVKKFFMDEWACELYETEFEAVHGALERASTGVLAELKR